MKFLTPLKFRYRYITWPIRYPKKNQLLTIHQLSCYTTQIKRSAMELPPFEVIRQGLQTRAQEIKVCHLSSDQEC